MRRTYSIAIISALCTFGTVALSTASQAEPLRGASQAFNKQLEELVFLCESAGDSDARFRCLLDQASRLNQAKNLARQRGEQENGGVTVIETEPSMHGPSSEAPHEISLSGDTIEYLFTYRLRPRATEDFTQETQVLVTYNTAVNAWDIETVYNRAIAPTPCSFASELEGECF
jgi:hypothetical protein